ncbi:BtpA/SgcQ family protein [Dactylosporangium sp. CA-092794]|uniref:BtpA/SgcQ family protein n=1 Tax=Dactylosporangium sp. CA-092794 TaxID=3239929 RepID=UPI003D946BB1
MFDRKPVVAMVHFPPLPGTPDYDAAAGVAGIYDAVARDLEYLLVDGIDAVMFCNEGDRPYQLRAGSEIVAAMAFVIGRVTPLDRPFGVNVLWDPRATLGLAAGTGAAFMREVVTGAYESDMGLWQPGAGQLGRDRRYLDARDVELWFNITPEYAARLSARPLGMVARSVVQSSMPEVILVSGPMAGVQPDVSAVAEAKEAVGARQRVYVNTGVKAATVAGFLGVADGVIVGSDLKVDGNTWNAVDPDRVARFVDAAAAAR